MLIHKSIQAGGCRGISHPEEVLGHPAVATEHDVQQRLVPEAGPHPGSPALCTRVETHRLPQD